MKSKRKYSKHDELLISEPSGDANNLLLIHQGHLRARQHCNAGGNITKYIIRQFTEKNTMWEQPAFQTGISVSTPQVSCTATEEFIVL